MSIFLRAGTPVILGTPLGLGSPSDYDFSQLSSNSQQAAATATVSPGFDWSKLAVAGLNVAGSVAPTLIQQFAPASVQKPATQIIQTLTAPLPPAAIPAYYPPPAPPTPWGTYAIVAAVLFAAFKLLGGRR